MAAAPSAARSHCSTGRHAGHGPRGLRSLLARLGCPPRRGGGGVVAIHSSRSLQSGSGGLLRGCARSVSTCIAIVASHLCHIHRTFGPTLETETPRRLLRRSGCCSPRHELLITDPLAWIAIRLLFLIPTEHSTIAGLSSNVRIHPESVNNDGWICGRYCKTHSRVSSLAGHRSEVKSVNTTSRNNDRITITVQGMHTAFPSITSSNGGHTATAGAPSPVLRHTASY